MLIRVMLCFLGKVEGVSRGIAVLVCNIIEMEIKRGKVQMKPSNELHPKKGWKALLPNRQKVVSLYKGPVYFVMHSNQTENMIIKVTLHYSLHLLATLFCLLILGFQSSKLLKLLCCTLYCNII